MIGGGGGRLSEEPAYIYIYTSMHIYYDDDLMANYRLIINGSNECTIHLKFRNSKIYFQLQMQLCKILFKTFMIIRAIAA